MIENGDVQVIDSREPWEYDEGHVPGAHNITHMATLPRARELATDKPILFVCKSGQRSAVAAEFAATMGLTDLYNVEGGTLAWIAAVNRFTSDFSASTIAWRIRTYVFEKPQPFFDAHA